MTDRKNSLHMLHPTAPTKALQHSTHINKPKKERKTLQPQNNPTLTNNQQKKKHKHENKSKERLTMKKEKNTLGGKQNLKVQGFGRFTFEQGMLNKLNKLTFLEGLATINILGSFDPQKQKKVQRYSRKLSSEQLSFYTKSKMGQKKNNFHKGLFRYKHVIGKGGFGKVWKVELKRNGKIYALKQMSKALIMAKKSIPSVMNEKKLLNCLKNDFLVNMIQSFQDRQRLYLIMDYLPGGDLRELFSGYRSPFTEQQTKFTLVCILFGLEYLHNKNIIHRDIKPENLVLDDLGYIRVTDLGIARVYRNNNYHDTSGTPGYMAPQVLCLQNHTYSVDFFAVGVIGFEMMFKKRPYYGRNRKQIRDQILSRQVQIKKHEIPEDWSLQSADFFNRLLQRKPHHRLGYNSMGQIWNHPWLRNYPMQKIKKKEYPSPLAGIPKRISYNLAIHSQNTQQRQLQMQNEILVRNEDIQKLFIGYES